MDLPIVRCWWLTQSDLNINLAGTPRIIHAPVHAYNSGVDHERRKMINGFHYGTDRIKKQTIII